MIKLADCFINNTDKISKKVTLFIKCVIIINKQLKVLNNNERGCTKDMCRLLISRI